MSNGTSSSNDQGLQPPPKTYTKFSSRFPRIAAAWNLLREQEESGPLDEKTRRLVKLAAALARGSEGGTHSATRKARAAGATPDEMFQVVALAASIIGLPAAVAGFTWVEDVLD